MIDYPLLFTDKDTSKLAHIKTYRKKCIDIGTLCYKTDYKLYFCNFL